MERAEAGAPLFENAGMEDARYLVERAATDRVRGAADIAADAAAGLGMLAEEHPDPDSLVPVFLEAARALLVGQPAMAPLWRLVNDCLLAADLAEGPEFAADAIAEAASGFRAHLSRAGQKLTHELAPLLRREDRQPDVLTFSASSAVEAALVALAGAGRLGMVWCCRSSPGDEGAALATRLRSRRVRVELLDDAQAGVAVREVDAILLGADAVGPERMINKVGSGLVAAAGAVAGLRAYVVADTTKAVPEPVARVLEARIGTDPASAVFEAVPWSSLAGWVCESGLLAGGGVAPMVATIGLHPRLLDLAKDLTPER